MNQVSLENLLLVGKVLRPHGLGGLLRIQSYAESEESFRRAGMLYLQRISGEPEPRKVKSIRPHKNVILLKLEGLHTVDEAEGYRGASIFIRKDALKRDSDDEFFWHELIGLQVYLNTGKYLGDITHILTTGSNDVYVVGKGKKEILIPAIHEVVEEIDLDGKRMIISEMEGLLNLNEV